MKTGWMVRAGHYGSLFHHFEAEKMVALGWPELGDLNQYLTQDELQRACAALYSSEGKRIAQRVATQAWNFFQGIHKGDLIVSYCNRRREYILCEDMGEYRFEQHLVPHHPHLRKVRILGYKKRDVLKVMSRNAVSVTAPVFRLNDDVINDLLALPGDPELLRDDESEALAESQHNLQAQSLELVKDKLCRLNKPQLLQLVQGLLAVAGWRSVLMANDDCVNQSLEASKDGAGLTDVVQVTVVQQLSGLESSDLQPIVSALRGQRKGLVATPGHLSQDAQHWLAQQAVELQVWDINRLAQQLLMDYSQLNAATQALIPLTPVYWPNH